MKSRYINSYDVRGSFDGNREGQHGPTTLIAMRQVAHESVLSTSTTINELQRHIAACSGHVSIIPQFLRRVRSYGRVLDYRVGGAINDEDVAPIRFPPRHLCGKVFIGKCEAPVMFFLECVVAIAGIQIASLPERDQARKHTDRDAGPTRTQRHSYHPRHLYPDYRPGGRPTRMVNQVTNRILGLDEEVEPGSVQ